MGQKLTDFYEQVLKRYLFDKLVPHVQNQRGEAVLTSYLKSWQDFTIVATLIQRLFAYLDKFYLKQHHLETLGERALKMYFKFF